MTKDQKDAFDAVEKINDELFRKYDKLNDNDLCKDWLAVLPVVSITFAGPYIFIGLGLVSNGCTQLPEIHLYNSENSDRIYYEKTNRYETYYKYIKRKFLEVKEEICAVKL